MEFYEQILRHYSNKVTIVYENINNNIYIHSITSFNRKKGFANDSLREFINEFKNHNIYLNSISAFGTDTTILNKWFEKIGFIKHDNVDYIPHNISHAIINI